MFSGKSTYIIRNYDLYKKKMKTLIINYDKDNRYDNGDYICSHNLEKRVAIKLNKLNDLKKEYYENEYFLIDEGHFFIDLNKFVLKLLKLNKKITVIGLNGDIYGNVFKNIVSLIPYCEGIKYLTAICRLCKDENKAYMHIKKYNRKDEKSENEYKKVGGEEEYDSVCLFHYNLNKI